MASTTHELNVRRSVMPDRAFYAQERALKRQDRLLALAQDHIGRLVRDGKEVTYVWPAGRAYREGTELALARHLNRIGVINA